MNLQMVRDPYLHLTACSFVHTTVEKTLNVGTSSPICNCVLVLCVILDGVLREGGILEHCPLN